MTAESIVIRNNRWEALKRWIICVVVVVGSVFFFKYGVEKDRLRYEVVSVVAALYCGVYSFYYLWLTLSTRIYMIIDESGVSKSDGTVRVAWGEVEYFYFDRNKRTTPLVAVTKDGNRVPFSTGNVVTISELTELLTRHGAVVHTGKKKK